MDNFVDVNLFDPNFQMQRGKTVQLGQSEINQIRADKKRPYSPESVKFATSDVMSVNSGATQIQNNSR